jgi:choline dehydrogenase-like flavoprotein
MIDEDGQGDYSLTGGWRTDVAIVGSGPVGAAFARLLTEANQGLDVTVFDAGPLLAEPPGVNVRNLADPEAQARARTGSAGPQRADAASGVPVQVQGTVTAREGTYLVDPGSVGMPAAAASACVGGMGTLWTCAVPEPRDSERIPFIDDAQWRTDLEVAGNLLARTTDAFHDSPHVSAIRSRVAELFDDLLPADRKVGILPVAGNVQTDGSLRWAGVDTVLGSARINLRPNALVREVLLDGTVARGVLVEDLQTGERTEVQARAVIVAGGSWHTPQLLWASGLRPAALGHYLSEHPLTFAVVALNSSLAAAAGGLPPKPGVDPVTGVVCVPFADPGHPFHAQIMHLDKPMFPADLSDVEVTSAGFAAMGWGCRKQPRFEDAVTFSDDALDDRGMPRPHISYELTVTEERELADAQRHLERAAEALGSYIPGGQPRRMPAGSSIHYLGTVRMGEDGGDTSVCNSDSSVWGFENLFVGGNGVIPTATACNPTLTSVTLAVRASRRVLEVIAR